MEEEHHSLNYVTTLTVVNVCIELKSVYTYIYMQSPIQEASIHEQFSRECFPLCHVWYMIRGLSLYFPFEERQAFQIFMVPGGTYELRTNMLNSTQVFSLLNVFLQYYWWLRLWRLTEGQSKDTFSDLTEYHNLIKFFLSKRMCDGVTIAQLTVIIHK